MTILTLNCGSSSAKYQLYDWDSHDVIAVGLVERIGQDLSNLEHKIPGKEDYTEQKNCPDHEKAVSWIIETILDSGHGCLKDINEIKAVGHRVLHGGEAFKQSVIVDDKVMEVFKSLVHLGPLHMPANIGGIEAAKSVLPNVPHCAVMDTAWHQTMPDYAYLYPLPMEWYEKYNVRRYGFHGTSYLYTAKRASVLLGKSAEETNLVIAHIGNGASICAVKNGCCVDTSMGLTPLEGLMMGTRCGDIDPAIIPYMMDNLGITAKEMDAILNKKSGVLGITGDTIDRRDVHAGFERGEEKCIRALEMEAYRIKKYIGSYIAALGQIDALVITAGVGEMNPVYREHFLGGLEGVGVHLDPKKNQISKSRNCETCVSTDDSPVKILIIPTDEELVITEDAYALQQGTYDIHTRFKYTFQNENYVNKAREKALAGDLSRNPELKEIIVNH